MLIIDPATGHADTTTITGTELDNPRKWYGGVLAPNGRIYAMPWNSAYVLVIDPATDTADATAITVAPTGVDNKWVGGGLALDGKIYGIPRASDRVLVIDPMNNTADTTSITGLGAGDKWSGGVYGFDGKIYGIPRDSASVLVVDPASRTAIADGIPLPSPGPPLPTDPGKWLGGVLAADGKIYGIPRASPSVLIIDLKLVGAVSDQILECGYLNKF